MNNAKTTFSAHGKNSSSSRDPKRVGRTPWRYLIPGLLCALAGCAPVREDNAGAGEASEHAFGAAEPRVLVILSSASSVELACGGDTAAGVYLAEATLPVSSMIRFVAFVSTW